jgi:septum formation inhibitor MinC
VNIQIIILVGCLGGGLIGAGAWIVNGQIDARVVAEQNAVASKISAETANARVAQLESDLVKESERQEKLQIELQAARDLEATTTEVLEDRRRLESLTAAKPKLLERLARKATTKVWNEIESESRQ